MSSEQPCLRKSSAKYACLLAAQHCGGPDLIRSHRKCTCLFHSLRVTSPQKLLGFGEGTCSSQRNSVQLCRISVQKFLTSFSSLFFFLLFFFFSGCARRDVKLHQEPKLPIQKTRVAESLPFRHLRGGIWDAIPPPQTI